MYKRFTSLIAVGLIAGCSETTTGEQEQGIFAPGPIGADASVPIPDPDPLPPEVDPVPSPPDYPDLPDDAYACETAPLTRALRSISVPVACGQCDTDEYGVVVDPYCYDLGPPSDGPTSVCLGSENPTPIPTTIGTWPLPLPIPGLISCDGPVVAAKKHLLPSEHTKKIKEIFFAYPVSGRGLFATLPAASSALVPKPGALPRVSQAKIQRFILRAMTAASGRRTTDKDAKDHAETDLVQITVVSNRVENAVEDIRKHLQKTRADGGLGLSEDDAKDVAGPATEAKYRGAGKIRVADVPVESIWIRDYGPHILQLRDPKNTEQVVMDFGYHNDRKTDDAVPSKLFGLKATLWPGATMTYVDANDGTKQIKTGTPLVASNWTADNSAGPTNGLKDEGGNLSSDGFGKCLTTWKNTRPKGTWDKPGDDGGLHGYFEPNDEMTFADQRDRLKKLLGCEHVTVLPRLPFHFNKDSEVQTGDGTGHVDMLTHFYGENKVLLAESAKGDAKCDDYDGGTFIDEFNKRTCKALKDAKAQLIANGYKEEDILRVPYLDVTNGNRAARSTTNLMESGNRVMYITYDGMTAAELKKLRDNLAAAYPGRQLFELDGTDIIQRGGAIHCTTIGMQELE